MTNQDWMKDWAVAQWRELAGTDANDRKHGTSRESGTPAEPARFHPVSPYAVATTAVAFLVPRLPVAVSGNQKVNGALGILHDWRWALLVIVIMVAVVDVARYRVHRWTQTLTEIVRQATTHDPVKVRVSTPRPPAPSVLRRAKVTLRRGSIVRPKALDEVRRAVASAFETDPEWKVGVTHDGPRDALVVTRSRIEPDTRSARHRALQEALDAGSILKDSAVSVTEVSGGVENSYRITFARSMNAAAPRFQMNVAEALAGMAGPHESGRQWTTDWYPPDGYLIMRLVAKIPARVNHPLELMDENLRHLPYATGASDRILFWDISTSSNAPHCLITGRTGGGKTSVIRTLLTEAARRGIPFLGVDPKMIELDGLEGYAGCGAIVYDAIRAAMLVRALHTEMTARNNYIHVKKIDGSQLPLLIVVLDEFFILSGKWQMLAKTGDEDTKALLATLNPLAAWADLAVLARSAGIRLLLGVQRPDASLFGGASGNARDNFGTRISLGNLSQDGALMMWGDSTIGREADTSVKGRGIALGEDGVPVDAQMWWTPNVDKHPNRWSQLSDDERDIVTGLEPAEAPAFTCYSTELAAFIESERALARRARELGSVDEPMVLGTGTDARAVDLTKPDSATADPATAADDDPADAIPASAVEPGQRVLVEGDDGSSLVEVTVDEIDVERHPVTGDVVGVTLTIVTGRVRTTLAYPPTGIVFLPEADLAAV